ncbi:MAG: thioredoxin family protein, partial [Desulfovibrionaceae bacterium]|nr:thioredoxin family protein [Desulfovibrionaceae bacterium]
MEITVCGPSCPECAQLENLVRETVAVMEPGIDVRRMSGFGNLLARGILRIPAIVVDGCVKASGRVPSRAELAAWIGEA